MTAHPAGRHGYITTHVGANIKIPLLSRSQIHQEDIVRSLALQCRFLGHLSRFYSVAEHSVHVAAIAKNSGEGRRGVRASLLHDAHEAYMGDIASPQKLQLPDVQEMERALETNFRSIVGLPGPQDPVWDRVRTYDIQSLHVEAYLFKDITPDWCDVELAKSILGSVEFHPLGLEWQRAEVLFNSAINEIGLFGSDQLDRDEERG